MYLKSILICLTFLIVFAQSQYTQTIDVTGFVPRRYSLAQKNKHIVGGYFPSWKEGYAGEQDFKATALRNLPDYINTVMLGFAKPNLRYTKGTFNIRESGLQVPYSGKALLNSVLALKKKNITVLITLGGETYWQGASWSPNPACFDINYNQIKDFLDDMALDGIEWDYSPGYHQIASTKHINKYIEFITKSRDVLPKSANYMISVAPKGIGAMGNYMDTNLDDPESPWNAARGKRFGSGMHWTQATQMGAPIGTLWSYANTGHFIPVMKAVGNKLDLVNLRGYNVGGADRLYMYDSFAYYGKKHGFAVTFSVSVSDEPWGPYFIFNNEMVQTLSSYIKFGGDAHNASPYDGITMWNVLEEAWRGKSKGNHPYRFCVIADQILNQNKNGQQALKAAEAVVPPVSQKPWWMR